MRGAAMSVILTLVVASDLAIVVWFITNKLTVPATYGLSLYGIL